MEIVLVVIALLFIANSIITLMTIWQKLQGIKLNRELLKQHEKDTIYVPGEIEIRSFGPEQDSSNRPID